MALGHGHPYVLENVYLGALLHDYGMSKVPENVLLNPQTNLYAHHNEVHPKMGVKLVKKLEAVPNQVLTIILIKFCTINLNLNTPKTDVKKFDCEIIWLVAIL